MRNESIILGPFLLKWGHAFRIEVSMSCSRVEMRRRLALPVLAAFCFMGELHGAGQRAPAAQPAPVHLTAEQDRKRMLDFLGLKESELRPRPDGDARSPHATNYDEAKANIYPNLPDPLVFKSGQKVTSAHAWAERRKEIKADFDHEILGV